MKLHFVLLTIVVLILAACTVSSEGSGSLSDLEERAQPAETAAATAVATVTSPAPVCEDLPEVTTDGEDGVTVPENAVAVFQKTGGFAGVEETTVIYADGLIKNNKGEETEVPPQVVDTFVTTAVDIGFFDLKGNYVPEGHCCDFFNYSLTIRDCERVHTVITAEGVPDLPTELMEIINTVQSLIANTSAAVPPVGTVDLSELTPDPESDGENITRPVPGTPG